MFFEFLYCCLCCAVQLVCISVAIRQKSINSILKNITSRFAKSFAEYYRIVLIGCHVSNNANYSCTATFIDTFLWATPPPPILDSFNDNLRNGTRFNIRGGACLFMSPAQLWCTWQSLVQSCKFMRRLKYLELVTFLSEAYFLVYICI